MKKNINSYYGKNTDFHKQEKLLIFILFNQMILGIQYFIYNLNNFSIDKTSFISSKICLKYHGS